MVGLGLLGILHRRNPERLFLLLSVLLGMLMVTMGHTGSVQGWFAEDLQAALDGALAPLRNVHKFDPIIRLPMVLGLAWSVEWLLVQMRRGSAPDTDRKAAALRRLNIGAVLVHRRRRGRWRRAPGGGRADHADRRLHGGAGLLVRRPRTGSTTATRPR